MLRFRVCVKHKAINACRRNCFHSSSLTSQSSQNFTNFSLLWKRHKFLSYSQRHSIWEKITAISVIIMLMMIVKQTLRISIIDRSSSYPVMLYSLSRPFYSYQKYLESHHLLMWTFTFSKRLVLQFMTWLVKFKAFF